MTPAAILTTQVNGVISVRAEERQRGLVLWCMPGVDRILKMTSSFKSTLSAISDDQFIRAAS
jgi:hypothetical protein